MIGWIRWKHNNRANHSVGSFPNENRDKSNIISGQLQYVRSNRQEIRLTFEMADINFINLPDVLLEEYFFEINF